MTLSGNMEDANTFIAYQQVSEAGGLPAAGMEILSVTCLKIQTVCTFGYLNCPHFPINFFLLTVQYFPCYQSLSIPLIYELLCPDSCWIRNGYG